MANLRSNNFVDFDVIPVADPGTGPQYGRVTNTDDFYLWNGASWDLLPSESTSFGTDNQVPFTNAGGTDFDYSANLTFGNTELNILNSDLTVGGGTGFAFRFVASSNRISLGENITPQTNFHISENNADTIPAIEIEQLSTGDAALQFSIPGDAYAVGIDNSDGDTFKISYAAAEGTAVLGTNDLLTLSSAGAVNINGSIQVDSIVNDTGLAAGTYTPTRSAEVNMDANVTMTEAQYMRVGNTVTVSGRFNADATFAGFTTSFNITLPIASNIGAVEDVAGVAFSEDIAGQGAAIFGNAANNVATISWISGNLGSLNWSYTFTYQVI